MLSGQGIRRVSGIIFDKCDFEGPPLHLCLAGMLSWHCYEHMLQMAVERKRHVCSVKVCQGNWERVLLWHQEAPRFRHVPISLPVRGPLGNCYFGIYVLFHVYFIFIVIFLCYCFFHFLFNPHRYPLKYWREEKFGDTILQLCNTEYKQDKI